MNTKLHYDENQSESNPLITQNKVKLMIMMLKNQHEEDIKELHIRQNFLYRCCLYFNAGFYALFFLMKASV